MKELKTKVSRKRQCVFRWSLDIEKDIEISCDGPMIYAPEEVIRFISKTLNENAYRNSIDLKGCPNIDIDEQCLTRIIETSRSQELLIRIYKINYVFE